MLFDTKPIAWKPSRYMVKAMKFLLEHAAAGLFLDPGGRKTSITLGAFKILVAEEMAQTALVIAPLRVVYNVWPNEVQKWADFNHLVVNIIHDEDPEQMELNTHRPAHIHLINPEGLQWLGQKGRLRRLKADTLIVDESIKLKNTTGKRFQALRPFLPKFQRRWILTGNPAPNGLEDVYGQAYLMDLGRVFGPYITHFRRKYFLPSGFGGYQWQVRDGAEKEIYKALKPLVLRMESKDYGHELPQLVPVPIKVVLPPKARKAYDEMEAELFTEVDNEELNAVNGGVASSKCHQIANGGVYLAKKIDLETGLPVGGKREWLRIHDAKTEALDELVGELQGQSLMIAYHFGHDLERLKELFGNDVPHLGSGVSTAKEAQVIAAWNRGELPILVGHPASMGHGLNLQEGDCARVAFYSQTWNYDYYDQFIRRVLRSGNKSLRVWAYSFIAENTVDEAISLSMVSKYSTQRQLLDAMRTYMRQRRVGTLLRSK